MKKSLLVLVASATLGLASPCLMAADPSTDTSTTTKAAAKTSSEAVPFQAARDKLKKMTPAERKTFMKEAHTKWEKLSPEEKVKFKLEMREKMHMMKKHQAERKMEKIYSLYLLEQQ